MRCVDRRFWGRGWLAGILALVLASLCAEGAIAQVRASEAGGEILSTGSCRVVSGNVAEAKQGALQQALQRAMEMHVLERLGKEAFVANFARITRDLLPGVGKAVENYQVLSETQTRDTVHVLVRARLSERVLSDALKGAGIAATPPSTTRVLVMVTEGRGADATTWWKDPRTPAPLGPVELAINRVLDQSGLIPVNRAQPIPEAQIPQGPAAQVLESQEVLNWGRAFSADAVVFGKVNIVPGKELHLALKGIGTAKGETLLEVERTLPLKPGDTRPEEVQSVLEEALREPMERISSAQARVASPAAEGVRSFGVTLKGVSALKDMLAFREFLGRRVEGVRTVTYAGLRDNTARFTVTFEGDRNRLLGRLVNREDLPFPLEVDQTDQEGISLMIKRPKS